MAVAGDVAPVTIPEPFLAERFEPALSGLLEGVGLDTSFVYVDGHFVRGSSAGVSVWDHGFLYGDGVFEGIRAYSGRIFLLDEHLDRLYASAAGIGLPVPLERDEMAEVIRRTFLANGLDAGHARPVVTRGPGRPGVDPRRSVRPSVVVQAVGQPATHPARPIDVIVATVRRRSSRSIASSVKCLNYLDSVQARGEAAPAGADDAILLDLNDHVAEATGENVFIVRDGEVSTPTTSSALPGITRRVVIDHLMGRGTAVHERDIERTELWEADEVFLTGTAAEIVGVGRIDGQVVGDGELGPVTRSVMEWYRGYTASYPGLAIE